MGVGEVMSSKQQRQQMVTRLIAHDNVSSQPHLQELLKEQGIEATQATIATSRLHHNRTAVTT